MRWDLRGSEPFTAGTVPDPNVHLVFEDQGVPVKGVHTLRFTKVKCWKASPMSLA